MNTNRLNPTPHSSTRDGVVKNGAGSRQRGVTLVISLIFLLLLTILGVTAMNTSTLQEKMSGNLRDQDLAFQAAESALRGGEDAVNLIWVSGKPTPISIPSCPLSDLSCAWDTGATQVTLDSWWNDFRKEYRGTGTQLTETSRDPTYIVEHAATVTDSGVRGNCYGPGCYTGTSYYRITARGQGVTAFSQSMLESTYRIRN